MTDNKAFVENVEHSCRESVLCAKNFALCWDAPDPGEQGVRLQFLRDLACGEVQPRDRSMPGFGLAPERFDQARAHFYQQYQADPQGFIETHLSGGLWFSAACLMSEQLPELHYVVEGFLPQGLVLLASPPKYGKSWLALQLCLAVSAGQSFLGIPCRKAACLYLALEDGKQRLQKRLRRQLDGRGIPRDLYLETHAASLGEGLQAQLELFLGRHPDCRLVVIDTLQKVRDNASDSRGSVYAADYADMGRLKAFADRFGLCLVLVHHLRKMSDDADPFNRIAGSNGIFGAADAALVLTRAKREDPRTTLDLTGRDVEERRLVLRFDKDSCLWESLGSAADVEAADLAANYPADPLVRTVLQQVEAGDGKWQTHAKGFLDACKAVCGSCPVDTGPALARRLGRLAPLLLARDGIACTVRRNGNAGRSYLFRAGTCPTEPQ